MKLRSLRALGLSTAMLATAFAGTQEERVWVSPKKLDSAIEAVTETNPNLVYSWHGWVGSDGKVHMAKGHEKEAKGLACSSFASAVLHWLQKGSFKGINLTVHAHFGANKMATHYGLGEPVDLHAIKVTPPMSRACVELSKFRESYATVKGGKNRENRKALEGVYLFEVVRKDVPQKGGKKKDQAHVGFLVIEEDGIRQVHFSGLKAYKGLADDRAFFKGFVDASQYREGDKARYGAHESTIQMWRISQPHGV